MSFGMSSGLCCTCTAVPPLPCQSCLTHCLTGLHSKSSSSRLPAYNFHLSALSWGAWLHTRGFPKDLIPLLPHTRHAGMSLQWTHKEKQSCLNWTCSMFPSYIMFFILLMKLGPVKSEKLILGLGKITFTYFVSLYFSWTWVLTGWT